MCIAVPGCVETIDGERAIVAWGTRRQQVSTMLLPDVAVGEWVLVTGGMIVERIDEAEAAMRREAFDEMLSLFDEANEEKPDDAIA